MVIVLSTLNNVKILWVRQRDCCDGIERNNRVFIAIKGIIGKKIVKGIDKNTLKFIIIMYFHPTYEELKLRELRERYPDKEKISILPMRN